MEAIAGRKVLLTLRLTSPPSATSLTKPSPPTYNQIIMLIKPLLGLVGATATATAAPAPTASSSMNIWANTSNV